MLWWLLTSIALAVVIVAVVGGPGPLDDPDQGDQRPGFLTPVEEARDVGGLRLPGDPIGRRPLILFFDRRPPPAQGLERLLTDVPGRLTTLLVLPRAPGRTPPGLPPRVELVVDPHRSIARNAGMPVPKDGGPPVGYALIDSDARVRYATLDPTYLEHGFELEVVAEDVE